MLSFVVKLTAYLLLLAAHHFNNKTTPYVGHFSSDRMRLKFPLTDHKAKYSQAYKSEDVLVLFIRCMSFVECLDL